jgi:hypothetical protein
MFDHSYKRRGFIVVKTPHAQVIDSYEFTIGEIDDVSQFDSSLSYEHKVQNLHKIKNYKTVDSMEKVDLILTGIAIAVGNCEIIKIKFPKPFSTLLKISKSSTADFKELFENASKIFEDLFGKFK